MTLALVLVVTHLLSMPLLAICAIHVAGSQLSVESEHSSVRAALESQHGHVDPCSFDASFRPV